MSYLQTLIIDSPTTTFDWFSFDNIVNNILRLAFSTFTFFILFVITLKTYQETIESSENPNVQVVQPLVAEN